MLLYGEGVEAQLSEQKAIPIASAYCQTLGGRTRGGGMAAAAPTISRLSTQFPPLNSQRISQGGSEVPSTGVRPPGRRANIDLLYQVYQAQPERSENASAGGTTSILRNVRPVTLVPVHSTLCLYPSIQNSPRIFAVSKKRCAGIPAAKGWGVKTQRYS